MPTETDHNEVAGPDLLADGVHLITLPLPVEGLSTVNAYALETSKGLVLVDPGWATRASAAALEAALAALGYRLGDVTTMVATHAHWDHYTQAVAIRAEHGGRLLLGSGERHSVEAFATHASYFPHQVGLLRRAGAEALADTVAALPYRSDDSRVPPFGPPDGWLSDGDVLDFGDRQLVVHATPGHTRGHIVISDAASGLMFTGDHILPRITPSIGFEREPEATPLVSFLSSLRRMLDLPDARLAPAHGAVGPSVHVRAAELLDHHRERLAEIHAEAQRGRTPFEIAAELTWTRAGRRLDELGVLHQMLAVLEVAAHAEHEALPATGVGGAATG